MKTLADMTEEERAECQGMWCEDIYGGLYIYLGHTPGGTTHDEETGAPMGAFIDTQEPDIIEAPLGAFTPRIDLPGAWQTDGQPPLTQYWTLEQAADYTQLSTRTLRRRIADGSLTAYRHGRTIRLKPQDIDTLFTRVEPREMDEA